MSEQSESKYLSRRRMLGGFAAAAVSATAGCNHKNAGTPTSSTSPTTTTGGTDSFSYPAGFTKTGIDKKKAFGKQSAMARLDSVGANVDRLVDIADRKTRKSTTKGDFDVANDKFFVDSQQTIGDKTEKSQYYYSNGIIYIRTNPSDGKTSYTKNTYKLNKLQVYNLRQITQHITDLSMTVSEVRSTENGPVAVYTAGKEDVGAKSLFKRLGSNGFGQLQSLSAQLIVDENGYVHKASFEASYKRTDGSKANLRTVFTFEDFNSVSVTKPDWVETADFTDLTTNPKVDVTFSEKRGESVTVTVKSINKADFVDVVIGQSLVKKFKEPGSVTIDAAEYTVRGETAKISVFAYKEGQRPSKVAEYKPKAPAGQTGTSTPTPTPTPNSSG